MKIHLVDGTYELFRSYFGAPPAKSKSGQEVGASRGFLSSMIALLRDDGVTHIGAAFDHTVESFRNELFEGYKTGEGIEPELWEQFPWVERISRALGLQTWPMERFEADDALATVAHRFIAEPDVEQIVICTPDKDLCQCVVGERVVVWDRRRGVTLDQTGVVEKFGVSPESIPDYLALVGDSADGIPGVPRWGAKSASVVLAKFGRIEEIPASVGEWGIKVRGADALSESLNGLRAEAALYKELATLRKDATPSATTLDELRWAGPDMAELEAVCDELDDPRALERVRLLISY
ncbi:MAG: 5'-3' exonuclease H3TH domain-containing protein [Polyangiales bacterium]